MKKGGADKIKAVEEKARDIIANRQQAYHQTFNPENVFVKIVLEDLADFCRAHQTTFHQDPRLHAVLEGRREVWLRIMDHLGLQSYELQNKVLKKWGTNDDRSNTKRTNSSDTDKRVSGTAEFITDKPDDSGLGLDDGT